MKNLLNAGFTIIATIGGFVLLATVPELVLSGLAWLAVGATALTIVATVTPIIFATSTILFLLF